MSVSIYQKGEKLSAEPNVVPLCDVLLVLLIIFMVVTPLVQQGADVRLPTAINTVNMPENPEVVLYIKKDGSMLLNADKVTIDDIASKLEEAFLTVQDRKLYLKADGDLEYGKLVDVYEKIREAGIENIAIITQKKTEQG
ncbi:MAG: biopolymer transporter ExbD [Candidatus Aminicenantes bacterium]|nr:biopolymer transporter ExbD [Candidatus Aminicenantes bacterium]